MQKNFSDFSMQDVQRMLSSPAGQQLMALLQQSDTKALSDAVEQAKKGNLSRAKEALSPILANEEIKKLLKGVEG